MSAPVVATMKEWNDAGLSVKRGSRMVAKTRAGVPLFSEYQVEKRQRKRLILPRRSAFDVDDFAHYDDHPEKGR